MIIGRMVDRLPSETRSCITMSIWLLWDTRFGYGVRLAPGSSLPKCYALRGPERVAT
jgi:hypothetical protein